jgi:lysophospholipase L1-like esterase
MLLGDSIRMLYQPRVKALLKGRANVYGPVENGRWSDYTLNSLRFWIPQLPDADIVHLNCGFWDIGDNYKEGTSYTPIEEYERDMARTVRVLRQLISPDVKIIIALTTPWLAGSNEEVEKFNAALTRVANNAGLPIDDLYSPFADEPEKWLSPDKIHLNAEGADLAAKLVAEAIEPYLD